MKQNIVLRAFLHAAATLIYVAGVVWLMSNGERLFGNGNQDDHVLVPVFMLLLFLISACITSLLVLGRPIQLYLDGSKKESFNMLLGTVSWLILFLLLVGVAMLVV